MIHKYFKFHDIAQKSHLLCLDLNNCETLVTMTSAVVLIVSVVHSRTWMFFFDWLIDLETHVCLFLSICPPLSTCNQLKTITLTNVERHHKDTCCQTHFQLIIPSSPIISLSHHLISMLIFKIFHELIFLGFHLSSLNAFKIFMQWVSNQRRILQVV